MGSIVGWADRYILLCHGGYVTRGHVQGKNLQGSPAIGMEYICMAGIAGLRCVTGNFGITKLTAIKGIIHNCYY